MKIGWRQLDNVWYYLGNNGAIVTGWAEMDGKWYYLNPNGTMASNTTINGYKVDENGEWVK